MNMAEMQSECLGLTAQGVFLIGGREKTEEILTVKSGLSEEKRETFSFKHIKTGWF